MKVIMCSRTFPTEHRRKGESTYFVEKICKQLGQSGINIDGRIWKYVDETKFNLGSWMDATPKHHTIRTGSRFKPGDMVSLRVWSDKPYRSKQVEFAQVEIKKVWNIEIREFWFINGCIMEHEQVVELAKNDGLSYDDFVSWFNIHPKKKGDVFRGQIISWSNEINY